MTPATIIREVQADGVKLALSPAGTIKVAGDGAAVNRWLAMIREHKEEIIGVLKVGAVDTATASRWWRIHYHDGDALDLTFYPPATHEQVLGWHPGALSAEPYQPPARPPTAPLSDAEGARVRAWLDTIGETDPATIGEVLDKCETDREARAYFLGLASEVPGPDTWDRYEQRQLQA